MLPFKLQAMLKILFPEQAFGIYQRAYETLTQVGIQIMHKHTAFTWLQTSNIENIRSPIFIGGLGAPDNYFKNPPPPGIIAICDGEAGTFY